MTKKRDARYAFPTKFEFHVGDAPEMLFKGVIRNISTAGFSFLSHSPFEIGQTLTITKHVLPFACSAARVEGVTQVSDQYEIDVICIP